MSVSSSFPSAPPIACQNWISCCASAVECRQANVRIETSRRVIGARLYDVGTMAALSELSAADLSERYASGALSPVEVARACLERIEVCEPKLNAMYRVTREAALAAAAASESRWRAKN